MEITPPSDLEICLSITIFVVTVIELADCRANIFRIFRFIAINTNIIFIWKKSTQKKVSKTQ